MRYFVMSMVFGLFFMACALWIIFSPSLTSFCWGLLGMYISHKFASDYSKRITNPKYKPGDTVYLRSDGPQDVMELLAKSRVLKYRD